MLQLNFFLKTLTFKAVSLHLLAIDPRSRFFGKIQKYTQNLEKYSKLGKILVGTKKGPHLFLVEKSGKMVKIRKNTPEESGKILWEIRKNTPASG